MRRNEKALPDDKIAAAGFALERNPGVVCLWETKDYKPFKVNAGTAGILFRLGTPTRVDWICRNRAATRAEVLDSINSGFPELEKAAAHDGPEGMAALMQYRQRMESLLPPANGAGTT